MNITKKDRIPRIQPIDCKKLNKEKYPSEDALIPLRRGKKITTVGRVREGPRWERGRRV